MAPASLAWLGSTCWRLQPTTWIPQHPGDTTPPKVRASRTVAIATHREAFQRAVVQHGGSERGVVWAVSTPPGGEVKMPEMQQQQQRSNFLLAAATTNNAAAHAPTSSDEPESIPPWVHINEQDEQAPFLSPAPVVPNSRHYKPPQGNYKPGRKLDQFRNAEPGLLSTRIDQHQQRWIPFMQSSPMPHEHRDIRIIRSPQWMEENVPISSRKWEPEDEISPETNRRLGGLKGFMFRGKWLISPERQEKTVKLYWVSAECLDRRIFADCHRLTKNLRLTRFPATSTQKRVRAVGIPNNSAGLFMRSPWSRWNDITRRQQSQRRQRYQQPMRSSRINIHGHHRQRHRSTICGLRDMG